MVKLAQCYRLIGKSSDLVLGGLALNLHFLLLHCLHITKDLVIISPLFLPSLSCPQTKKKFHVKFW